MGRQRPGSLHHLGGWPRASAVLGLARVSCLGPYSHRGQQAWWSLGMSDSAIQKRGWLCPFKEKFKR